MKEIWKDIPGYEGLYRVSSLGNVKSLHVYRGSTERILKPNTIDKFGYQQVELRKNGKRKCSLIHRLVLQTFVGPCPDGMEGCHKDSNPKNNKLNNLKWDTPKNNVQDILFRGNHWFSNNIGHNRGSKHSLSKLNEKQVRIIKWLLKNSHLTQKEIGKIFDVSNITICDIKSGKLWKHV